MVSGLPKLCSLLAILWIVRILLNYRLHSQNHIHISQVLPLLRCGDTWQIWMDEVTPFQILTHWGRVTHICVGKLTIIGSDNGLSPGRHQAIIWTNTGILLIGPWGTNFSEILIKILTFLFKKMCLKVSSAKWHPFCLGLNVLNYPGPGIHMLIL